LLTDFNSAPEGATFHADVCIVGAGAAGITLAMELLASGKHILLVEGGDLRQSEESQSLYGIARTSPYFDPKRSRLRYFGGSTNHWEGSVRTFDPIDFEKRPWVANSGWPFSYQDLVPYYDRAFTYIDVPERFREEVPVLRHLEAFRQSLSSGGFQARVGYSSAPTRFGKKYLEQLRAAPNVTILTRANLMSINESPDRRSVKSLTICNYKRQSGTIAAANYIVALGGIENARALLLSDAVTPGGIGNEYDLVGRHFMDHPVIEGLVFYPRADFVKAWQEGRFAHNSRTYGVSLQASEEMLRQERLCNARMPLDWAPKIHTSRGIESAHQIQKALGGPEELDQVLVHLGNVFGDADLILEQWRRKKGYAPMVDRADEYGGHVVQMMMEQWPDPENRILLTQDRDALGLRKGRIAWRLPQAERDGFKRLVALFAKGVGAQGLGIVRSLVEEDETGRRFDELMNYGHHHMGTTRASAEPRTGVVNADLRIHGRENIFMAGSSVFPTGSHVPPTTTIVATAIRLADHLKKRMA
jgi:choline dehydrogenase-like flavoprotein